VSWRRLMWLVWLARRGPPRSEHCNTEGVKRQTPADVIPGSLPSGPRPIQRYSKNRFAVGIPSSTNSVSSPPFPPGLGSQLLPRRLRESSDGFQSPNGPATRPVIEGR
jgi:hypothetical protein